jgi:hypothetical protein
MNVPFEEYGRPVSAVPVTTAALELRVPAPIVVALARDLGLFRMKLGEAGELHVSQAALPELRRFVGLGGGRRIA